MTGHYFYFMFTRNITMITVYYYNILPFKTAKLEKLKVCLATATTQLQVVENYSKLLFNLWSNICKCWCLKTHFIPNITDFLKTNKTG